MKRIRGFSMLELMVAMALGLLISAAAIQLFLANQMSLNFQRGMNDVQANGRFAIDQMTREFMLAGLGPGVTTTASGTDDLSPVAFVNTDIPGLAAGQPVSTNNGQDSGIGQSDQIVIQYFANTDTIDCEGGNVPAGRYVVSRYFIAEDAANNDSPSLMCDAGSHNGTAMTVSGTAGDPANYGGAGTVLLAGVDSFQVLYGVDDLVITNATNNRAQVARYMTATQYNALAAPRPEVLAVRIGLFLRSQERASNEVELSAPADVQILDEALVGTTIPNDGLLRRLFITTIMLRNQDLRKV
ncbi:MAG: PilW family protein [Pseudomonadota bacterium]